MKNNKKRNIRLVMWFIFLSTLGVGGGIFFLLFAVVPIEQIYVDRGWSQFNIDKIMKYYVFGWVAFGFAMSFLYYFFILKRNFWKIGTLLMLSSIGLCIAGLYYFLNTGSSVVQSSQGEVDTHGERFTFGPYPEAADLKRLKEEGYDGVLALLSPTLPIEKPLLDREIANGKEANMPVISMPMLPWVGDNSDTLAAIKELINADDKRYYVHCYLGRHRVDVVKHLVSQELQLDFSLLAFEPSTFERGHVMHYDTQEVSFGPFPTDQEWFTRIRRNEVQEVISLLPSSNTEWLEKEKKIIAEMGISFTHYPIEESYTFEELQKINNYIQSLDHKVFIHDFKKSNALLQLDALYSWGHSLNLQSSILTNNNDILFKLGAKMLVGLPPSKSSRTALQQAGVRHFVEVSTLAKQDLYQLAKTQLAKKETTYFYVANEQLGAEFYKILKGLVFGSAEGVNEYRDIALTNGTTGQYKRNIVAGPILTDEEFESFALANGVAQILFLYPSSVIDQPTKAHIEEMAQKSGIPLELIIMKSGFEETLVSSINKQSGLTYILTDSMLLDVVNDYLKKY